MLGFDLPFLIANLIALFIALLVHEFAHAWTADHLGDDTPRQYGRLTLNPLRHLDIIGSLMLIFAGFGWAKPVPVNVYALNRKSPAALMWTAVAGPLSNLALAAFAAIPIRLHLVPIAFGDGILPSLYQVFMQFIIVNLSLFLFNLLPIAPLDGDKIADYFFPPAIGRVLEIIRPYGPLILLFLVFIPGRLGFNVIGWAMTPALQTLWTLLLGG